MDRVSEGSTKPSKTVFDSSRDENQTCLSITKDGNCSKTPKKLDGAVATARTPLTKSLKRTCSFLETPPPMRSELCLLRCYRRDELPSCKKVDGNDIYLQGLPRLPEFPGLDEPEPTLLIQPKTCATWSRTAMAIDNDLICRKMARHDFLHDETWRDASTAEHFQYLSAVVSTTSVHSSLKVVNQHLVSFTPLPRKINLKMRSNPMSSSKNKITFDTLAQSPAHDSLFLPL